MTTDFFDREAHAQKQTERLIWLFGLTVLAALVVNNLVLGLVASIFLHPYGGLHNGFPFNFFVTALNLFGEAVMEPGVFLKHVCDPTVMAWVSVGTLTSIAAGSYYKIRQLSDGGSVIAQLLGGRFITGGTTDPDEQRLRNVIQEMAVASGMPVPAIYVFDNERGINSFAAGHTYDDVAIGVTRGAVKLLTRDELQGVIAHEFSHILNGDTRLNMKLIGLAHGLFWPTILGRVLTYGDTERPPVGSSFLMDDDETKLLPTAPIGFLFILLGSISLPLVRLIKSAICRQREWLADSAAVQFTRNPGGIVGAFKKIGGLFKQGRLDSPHAEVASHLYFVECNYTPWFEFLAVHPPLLKRIIAIDPTFSGFYPKVTMLAPNQFERDRAFDDYVGHAFLGRKISDDLPKPFEEITGAHLKLVSLMRFNLPPLVTDALNTSAGAAAIVFLLILSEEDAVRARQMAILQTNFAPDTFKQVILLAPKIAALGDRYKFLLSEFAVPALTEYNTDEHDAFHLTLQQIMECDGSMDLFEYMLIKMVARQLRSRFQRLSLEKGLYGRIQELLPECTLLLSALAHLSSDDDTARQNAFTKGVQYLDAPGAKLQLLSRDQWDLSKVDAALTRLAAYHDPLKRNVLMACSKAVMANETVAERDAELLRAIADSLGCPMPPFVEAVIMEDLAKKEATV